jgi:hypothetical protein
MIYMELQSTLRGLGEAGSLRTCADKDEPMRLVAMAKNIPKSRAQN